MIHTKVFVILADEPRKFIYGKRGQTLSPIAYTLRCTPIGRRLLLFSSYHGFPRTYQRRLSN